MYSVYYHHLYEGSYYEYCDTYEEAKNLYDAIIESADLCNRDHVILWNGATLLEEKYIIDEED